MTMLTMTTTMMMVIRDDNDDAATGIVDRRYATITANA